jgi:hypothetical protein
MKSYENNKLKHFYLYSSVLGAIRAIMGLPFEHPFEVIKTICQTTKSQSSIYKIALSQYHIKGIPNGLYAGFLPNLTKNIIKAMYRYPLSLYLSHLFKSKLPTSILQFDGIHKILAGVSLSVMESFIICPLERLKILLIT